MGTFILNYAPTSKNRMDTLGTSLESWWSVVYAKFLALGFFTCNYYFHLLFWLLEYLNFGSILQMSLLSCRALIYKLSEAHKLYDFDFKKHFQAPDFFFTLKGAMREQVKKFLAPHSKKIDEFSPFFQWELEKVDFVADFTRAWIGLNLSMGTPKSFFWNFFV